MAITGLNLPIDIPWERVCVARDMVDPGRGVPAETPPLWQSSMALFRYVPPDEYQVYPGTTASAVAWPSGRSARGGPRLRAARR